VESAEVIKLVNEIMIDEFEVEEGDLRPEAELAEDLGLDSLDGVDLVVALEKIFKCRIPEKEARSIKTLGDVYEKIITRLQEAGTVAR
jgi:acyl carrier protein